MLVDAMKNFAERVRNVFNKQIENAEQLIQEAVAKTGEKAGTIATVSRIQFNMFVNRARRYGLVLREGIVTRWNGLYGSVKASIEQNLSGIREYCMDLRSIWKGNQNFSLWVIPEDGQKIAKKNVQKHHLKYAATGVLSLFFVMLTSIGVLAHFAVQSETQKQELLEYKQTKVAYEKTLDELRQVAEKNQQELAYLSKLEDKVRAAMEKNGTTLPPKSDAAAYAGKGGNDIGEADQLKVVMAQEKNIQNAVRARKADLEKLLETIEYENYRKEVTPSHWPTSGGFITSYFGGRANPFDGYSADWHSGIDIANDYGMPVYAAAAGYVSRARWYGGYGRYVRLNHDMGYVTAYAHMSSLAVSEGAYVKKGDVVGYVGSSGNSTGPHLHFEIYKNGTEVDPLKFVG